MEASLRGPFGRRALGPAGITIGRSPVNGLVINDMKASSRHAELRMDGQNYAIIDLGSTNGTFVNEQQLPARSSRLLQPGDVIRIGDTTLVFEASGLAQSDLYTLNGPTIRDSRSDLGVATNFGENYGAMQPNFGEVAAAQQSTPAPSQYGPAPAPSGYTPAPPQYGVPPTPTPLPFMPTPPPYAPTPTPTPTPTPAPSSLTPPQPQFTPAPPHHAGQAQDIEPQLPPSAPRSQPGTQRMSPSLRRSILLAAVAFIVIVAAASGFFVIHNNQVAQQNASATATADAHATATANANATGTAIANATGTAIANANATATARATSQYPPFTILALDDPLTANSASGWNSASQCQFTSAGYQISVAQSGFSETCFASSTSFTNFAYQVTMTISKGDCGGLIFRAGDNQNYYAFYVCQDGRFNAVLYVKGASAGSTKVASSGAIHSGLNQANTLAVIVQGTTYNLYANGQNIDTFNDRTFNHGAIGVLAVDLSSPTVVDYTNALVWTES